MRNLFILFIFVSLFSTSCKKTTSNNNNNKPTLNNTFGFGILSKAKGIWSGPVSSTTALGNFPEWIVDFRPISENQLSAKNELDTLNDIHMSFFIALYKNEYRVAFRNGGSFAGMHRSSYFLADSVFESSNYSFYRFSEIVKGKSRAYTDFIFRNDSMLMFSYTNKYNQQTTATLHMAWKAGLQDTTTAQIAVTNFGFPKKTLTKDFSNTFDGQSEAIYYSLSGDPYPETDQPYLGKTTIQYAFASSYTPSNNKQVFILITAQPLINGFSLNLTNMKYRSRYVILSSASRAFTFNYMHPGSYYVYALYDTDGNGYFSSGDWVSSANTSFTLAAKGNTNATVQINFTIP